MFEILQILDNIRKKKFYLMVAFLLAGMLLDIFSLAILVPLIELIIGNNSNILTTQVLLLTDKYFNGKALLPFSVFVILVFTIKTVYSIYLTYRQNRFISNLIRDTSNKLFSFYLHQNYSFHIQNNSAEVIRNLNTDLYHFATYLRSILFLFTEIGFVSSTLILLILLNPLISFGTILFFGVLIIVYYRIFRTKLNQLGEKKQKIALQHNKIVLESISSIKEMKVNQKELFFEKIFTSYSNQLWSIDTTHNTFLQVPRYILEFISILTIFMMLFFIFLDDGISGEVFSFFGVFIASVFKLIPSANKILNSLQNLKFSDSALNTIKSKLVSKTIKHRKSYVKRFDNLELKNIVFKYGQSEEILKDLNIVINRGDFIGVKGESGSGKTTLIDLILGLQTPNSGKILINGESNKMIKVGYVPQHTSILDVTIKDNVAFGVEKQDQETKKILESLKKAEILNFIESKDEGLEFIAGENGSKLSGGQKQRIGIARALYLEPDLLLLDEPTSALDIATEQSILKTLQKLSGEMTIVLISHNESLLKGCVKIYKLENKNLTLC